MNRFGGKMTIIRSRVLQILLMLVSIAGFAFAVVSFLYIEDDKNTSKNRNCFVNLINDSRVCYNEDEDYTFGYGYYEIYYKDDSHYEYYNFMDEKIFDSRDHKQEN